MSRFFRSADSTSSSGTDSGAESLNEREHDLSEAAEHSSQPVALTNAVTASSTATIGSGTQANHHTNFLLHALLEERCLNEVLKSYGSRPPPDAAEVQAEANRRYQRLCEQLSSYNLISTGLEEDRHATTRQRYRDGLDILTRHGTSRAAVPQTLKRLLTDGDADSVNLPVPERSTMIDFKDVSYRPAIPHHVQRLLTSLEGDQDSIPGVPSRAQTQSVGDGRYRREFEELSVLGRGGYGVVYHVRHRLDNQIYAVKKVPLSTARLQRIQHRGQSEIDEVLREVRTLARLDHPNIVRYFGGWIEWIDEPSGSHIVQSTDKSQFGDESQDVVSGASEDAESIGRVKTESTIDATDILFENSTSQDLSISRAFLEHRRFNTLDTSDESPAPDYEELRRIGTKSTIATVSDETVESVDRYVDPSFSMQSDASGINFTQPTLTLHMQMSLHPMTLADFLAPPSNDAAAPELRHCFHLIPSFSIVDAVLDGLEYLHAEGIVHRDIKPANIFLGPHNNPRNTRGSVDLLLCEHCRTQHTVTPMRLEVRIGDFGLVSVANPEVQSETATTTRHQEVVGTEIYRPSNLCQIASPALDVYALGIVAFELLCKFETRMERLDTIQKLKEGQFPKDFCSEIPVQQADDAQACVRVMLAVDGAATSVQETRHMVAALRS